MYFENIIVIYYCVIILVFAIIKSTIPYSLSERQIRSSRDLRRPLHLLQHRPVEILHHDSRQIDQGQECPGSKGHGNRTHAGGGQDPGHLQRQQDQDIRSQGSQFDMQV